MPVSRDHLATVFRQIRRDAGITHGGEAARRAGITQATVSRWERGQTVPTVEQACNYAQALNAQPALTGELVQLITDLRTNYRAGKPGPLPGASIHQRAQRLDATAQKILVFQTILVPGALQTAGYARAIFSSGDDIPRDELEDYVAARLTRSGLLGDPARHYTFILTEGVLAWCAATTAVMTEQLEHLVDISRRDNISLGLIPWGRPVTVFPPGGFDLYDDRTAVVGFPNGAQFFSDAADVQPYLDMSKALAELAVFHDEARAVLQTAAARYMA
jgi:transcriptional regulator with XRE-family HTH domain